MSRTRLERAIAQLKPDYSRGRNRDTGRARPCNAADVAMRAKKGNSSGAWLTDFMDKAFQCLIDAVRGRIDAGCDVRLITSPLSP